MPPYCPATRPRQCHLATYQEGQVVFSMQPRIPATQTMRRALERNYIELPGLN
jgi:hypothetical protein